MKLKARISEDVKAAMKARETARLGALRLATAAIKQREVDERRELEDADVLAVLEKMIKQRRESVSQYQKAGRQDLVDAEQFEIEVLQTYLPKAMTDGELAQEVSEALARLGARGPADMGRVMADLRPRVTGRADMARVSAMVKERLAG